MKTILLALVALLFAGAAQAATCSTYPYVLTNGTTADANQVMSNFNTARNCVINNAASIGANADITALSGLTTPLSIAQGGTGSTAPPWTNVYTTGGTLQTGNPHVVFGSVVIGGTGSTAVSLFGSAAFTTGSSYACSASDNAASPSPAGVSAPGTTSFTVNGSVGRTVSFVCAGS